MISADRVLEIVGQAMDAHKQAIQLHFRIYTEIKFSPAASVLYSYCGTYSMKRVTSLCNDILIMSFREHRVGVLINELIDELEIETSSPHCDFSAYKCSGTCPWDRGDITERDCDAPNCLIRKIER